MHRYLGHRVPAHVCYHCLKGVFPPRSHFKEEERLVFGPCLLAKRGRDRAEDFFHLVFYVADLFAREVVIFEPNGRTVGELWWLHNVFYRMNSLKLAPSFKANISEDDFMFKELRHVWEGKVGMSAWDAMLPGYCATLVLYYMVEWVCTEQWKSRTLSHFLRVSRDWVFSAPEMQDNLSSPHLSAHRIVDDVRCVCLAQLSETIPNLQDECVDLMLETRVLRDSKK